MEELKDAEVVQDIDLACIMASQSEPMEIVVVTAQILVIMEAIAKQR